MVVLRARVTDPASVRGARPHDARPDSRPRTAGSRGATTESRNMTATMTARASQKAARDPHIDNVKGVLIVLVVLGHTVGQMTGSHPAAGTLYAWIYQFHMPAFALLCGLLTTSGPLDGPRSAGLVRTLLVPYVLFQLAMGLPRGRGPGHGLERGPARRPRLPHVVPGGTLRLEAVGAAPRAAASRDGGRQARPGLRPDAVRPGRRTGTTDEVPGPARGGRSRLVARSPRDRTAAHGGRRAGGARRAAATPAAAQVSHQPRRCTPGRAYGRS